MKLVRVMLALAAAGCAAERQDQALPRRETAQAVVTPASGSPVDTTRPAVDSVASSSSADSTEASSDTMMYSWEGKNPQWLLAMFDTTIHWERGRRDSMPGKVECNTFAHYRVVTRDKETTTGSDIIVRDARGACTMDSVAGDFVLRNRFAEYFAAIRGNLLFINSGTGPQDSYALYDIPTGKELGWIEGEIAGWRDSTTAIIWERRGTGPHAMCPKVHPGLQVVIDSLYSWDLKTGRRTALGKMRCDQES